MVCISVVVSFISPTNDHGGFMTARCSSMALFLRSCGWLEEEEEERLVCSQCGVCTQPEFVSRIIMFYNLIINSGLSKRFTEVVENKCMAGWLMQLVIVGRPQWEIKSSSSFSTSPLQSQTNPTTTTTERPEKRRRELLSAAK